MSGALPHFVTGFLSDDSPMREAFPNGMVPLHHPQPVDADLEGLGRQKVYYLGCPGLKPETKDALAHLMVKLGRGTFAEGRAELDKPGHLLPVREVHITGVGMPLAAFI